jgi:hypothetical protein
MLPTVAAGLVCKDEGAFDWEGNAVVEVVVEMIVFLSVGGPVLWCGVGGDAGGAGAVLGAASGDTSVHPWVWGTSRAAVGIVAGGGGVLRHCEHFIGCDMGWSKVLVFGCSRSRHYISVSLLLQAPEVMGFAVPRWPVWPGAI